MTKPERAAPFSIAAKLSLFRKNVIAASLVMLSIVFELLFAVRILDAMVVDFRMGLSTFIDIVLLFLLFTCSVKMGVYDRTWTVVAACVSLFVLLRSLVLVPLFFKPEAHEVELQAYNLIVFACVAFACIQSLVAIRRRQAVLGSSEGKHLVSMVED
jgi:hypothetical protein